MKYINHFFIILLISFGGEILKCLLPLPIPASIYGMIILFLGLMTNGTDTDQSGLISMPFLTGCNIELENPY